MKKSESGITLVELMLVLSVLGVLLINIAPIGFGKSREIKLIDGVMSDIVAAINMARTAAIFEAKMVTFCRSSDGKNCKGQWHEGSIIFTDSNADKIINGQDRLLYKLDAIAAEGNLSFNSFRNRQYLQMTPRGTTNYQNGNFSFCPSNKNPALARQIIVSATGRTRYARDLDGDGVVENSKGQPLHCE